MQSEVISAFSRAACTYDKRAEFQYFAAQKLVDNIIKPPNHVLDIGCGTGIVTALLQQKFPDIFVTLVDISPQMLAVARQKLGDNNMNYICGSADDIYIINKIIQDKSVDLIVSNLCLQWLNNPLDIIKTYQSYVPVCISILLEKSFYQWYESLKAVSDIFEPPITLLPNTITDIQYLYHVTYKNGLDFLQTQKKLGTLVSQNKALTIRQLKNACRIFENNYDATISYQMGIIERQRR